MVRQPAVAGQFYAGSKTRLDEDLENLLPEVKEKIDAIGAIVPHAGYMYSGAVAGEVYSKIEVKDTYVILSPNHTGYGDRFAALGEAWETPLGEVSVDEDLLQAVMRNTSLVTESAEAHLYEHSIEVQLPFIQKTAPASKIVPITVQHGHISELKEVAGAISTAIREENRNVVILASSDMTHYESRTSVKEKDQIAIEKVLELDGEGLVEVVGINNISMCGYIPAAIMLMCAKELGSNKAELIRYTDSGDITGDTLQVVGYAGIIVY